MSVLNSDSTTLATIIEDPGFDEAHVAAAAFLARYNGRTLDAYRYDLRTFFQWAADAASPSWKRSDPTSTSTAPPWIRRVSPRRPSTADYRPSAASTGSPTSTD